jgi:hypothetical protein
VNYFLVAALLIGSVARADFSHPAPGEVAIRDAPNTDGSWQEARAIVYAPVGRVRAWLIDFPAWPSRFRDVASTEVIFQRDDAARVRLLSRIIGRAITVDISIRGDAITWYGREGPFESAGRIYISAAGNDRTDVVMQTCARVGGLFGVFAPKNAIKQRERQKLESDLADLVRLGFEFGRHRN